VQVQPDAATIVYVNTPRGGELTLDPGREVVARVVSASSDGSARINLAGQLLDVTTNASLRAGDEVRLTVTRADATGVRLAVIGPDVNGASPRGTAGAAAELVQQLARAGVPVNPQLAAAAAQVADQIGGSGSAARAVAELAGRSLVLSPAAAGRVAAALDLAGVLGPSLSSLAARSPAVAAALPGGTPNAAALRSLLAPGLSNGELAIARIVQSAQASAPGGPVTLATPPSSSAAVIQNYLSSQLAITTRLDQLATQNTTLGSSPLLQARAATAATAAALPTGLAADALQSALRGQGAAVQSPAAASRNLGPAPAPLPLPASAPPAPGTAAGHAATTAASTARANAHVAAATGAANAMSTPTGTRAAAAIADLATLAARFAPALAPAAGQVAATSASASRGVNAAATAQQAGPAGSVGASAASVAGAGAAGDPLPVVTSLQAWLASPRAESDTARLLRSMGGASPAVVAAAIRTLPEGQALQLAGRLLDMLPSASQLAGPALSDLRAGVHAALDQLGRSLQPPGGGDIASLRAALEHVAAHDARPAVAGDAGRLLAAVDGQQILSRTASGSDPGYVYFQVPLPDGRGAEVLVRRDPGRRKVSFDEFRIAFLLDTERLGTLMIELDAHPAGIRADVRTDIAELEPLLRECSDQLIDPLTREARRPVTITTGVFDQEPPTSLLEPTLGALEPGTNEFYA
jgi:trimeric autotransporter adhesin